MHEYRLYTQIPALRRAQVLNILAGISASQPVPITQQVLTYQQLKPDTTSAPVPKKGQAKPAGPPGQQARLNYVKIVRDIGGSEDGNDGGGGEVGRWRLREEGLPDPAAKTVTSAAVAERELDDADMAKLRPGSETHRFVSSYSSSGVRFVHHNIIVHMTRLYTVNLPPGEGQDLVDAPPPKLKNANLLDPSGAWLMEVCVRVDDAGDSSLREKAVKELEGFRRELEGAVDLRVPDRLALDPRVK